VQIKFVTVPVQNQAHALDFYTKVLGFEKASDLPAGEYRWLTVASPDGVEGVELLLEPLGFAPARDYQKALYDAGMPATAFTTTDIETDYERLKAAGVVFRGAPVVAGPVKTVLFEDTCGNLINLVQPAV
jgi:catechol 2,3-dioxygenase-like lactoylglutathione lyase family enzyme